MPYHPTTGATRLVTARVTIEVDLEFLVPVDAPVEATISWLDFHASNIAPADNTDAPVCVSDVRRTLIARKVTQIKTEVHN